MWHLNSYLNQRLSWYVVQRPTQNLSEPSICTNKNGLGGHYAKLEPEEQIHLHVESKKTNS